VPDRTDWHNLVFYRGLAKVVEQYVRKGDKLYVEGRIRYRSYDTQKGERRYVTEILVENMEMLSPRPQTDNQPSSPNTQHPLPVYHDRPIDIDILLYDDWIVDEPELRIPHPLMYKRDFVMIPLREILG
jgi:single stranded DNA-binding protein